MLFRSHSIRVQNLKDTNLIDSLVQQVAIHFFSDLHYGNRSPNIDYQGVTIKKDKNLISKEISSYLNKKGLQVLVDDIIGSSKEVSVLLKEFNTSNSPSTFEVKLTQLCVSSIIP